jgi:hypothetical protein
MELLTPSPLVVAVLALVYSALPITYLVLFVRAIRPPGLGPLRRFTAFTMVLGAALPILNILTILLGFNMLPLDLIDLSPIPAHLLHGYIQHVPFVFFMVSAILLLHPKAPQYALQVELTWGVILLINLAIFFLVAYQVITWTPLPPLPPASLPDDHLDPAQIILQHVMRVSRGRIALSMILPACWIIISSLALYKAFTGRQKSTPKPSPAPQP